MVNIKNSIKAALIFTSICLFSCSQKLIDINELDLKGNSNTEIVIEGAVFNFYGKQFVKLHKPAKLDTLVFEPISNAIIELYDGSETYSYIEGERAGEYYTVDSITCKPGRLYTLSVHYNGKTYLAKDSMKEVHIGENEMIPVDTVRYDILGRTDIYYKRHNYGFSERSAWEYVKYYEVEGIFWEKNPRRFYFSNSRVYAHTSAPLNGIMSGGRISGSAGSANTPIKYYKLSLSENYYRYLLSVFNETDWADNTFSAQPGNTLTNISEGGTGFFYASDIKQTTKTLGEVMRYYE